jgi:hypothetical protein
MQEEKEWTVQKKVKYGFARKKIKLAVHHDDKIGKLPLLMNKNNINEHYHLSLFGEKKKKTYLVIQRGSLLLKSCLE